MSIINTHVLFVSQGGGGHAVLRSEVGEGWHPPQGDFLGVHVPVEVEMT